MKGAGVSTSRARERHALGASLAAMLLVLLASALARAQSGADSTTASETWKTAAASAAATSAASGTPSNLVATPPEDTGTTLPGTAEIPTSGSVDVSQTPGIAPDSQTTADAEPSNEGNDIARYQEEQNGGMPPPQVLQQFDNDGELSTPFGMQLREAKRTLKSGEDADGLLITAVAKGSPAAVAGLHPYSHAVHDALAGVAMVGAMVPGGQPAILLIPMLDMFQIGESYDMIIGVDGSRVTNFLDFQDRMRDLQPGEIIYLSVVRNGKRLQVTIPITAATLQATN